MNPWDAAWVVFGWLVLVVLFILLVIVAAGSVAGVVQWFRKRPRRSKKLSQRDYDMYMNTARAQARLLYSAETQMPARIVEAFEHGAEWGYDNLTE